MKESTPLNILLINDDKDDVYILQEVAEMFIDKITLRNATPNTSILDCLQIGDMPDIILLDLHISKISGLEALKQLRSIKQLKNLPIIIYSGRQHSSTIKKCFNMGATVFVEKPHTYKGVERMVKKIIAIDWQKYKLNTKEHDFILQTEDY